MAAKKTTKKDSSKTWNQSMPKAQFEFMREILAAPSPIGLEGAMSYGVLKPAFEKLKAKDWEIHQFKGNASLILDTDPGNEDKISVMVIGHADKIRMQVRHISDDGKIWVNSDSFIPCVLIGHEVSLFSQDPKKPGNYRVIEGGTIEALGAIHFSEPAQRTGDKGISPEMLYLELQMHGEKPKKQIEELGIKAGDPIIFNRPIKRGFSEDTFYGAYLDNGLGCFTVAELAKLIAENPLKNIRMLFTIATHEEIGRFGAAAIAGELKPDVIFGVDVNHDYDAAPGMSSRRPNSLSMGKGCTITTGAITSDYLNALFEQACLDSDIPVQRDMSGRDTGTDAMAAALAGFDSAATSIGFPIRNMHTISETGHTGDVLAAIHGIEATVRKMDEMNRGKGITRDDFKNNHVRLDQVKPLKG
ncbi:MAG: peptidase M42 [Verrucomicrobiales bacterium]|nr:peptidase M42 [Verrucomicrobiales bacterium]